MFDDAREDGNGALASARRFPQFLAVVQIERDHGAFRFGRLHRLDDQLGGRFRQRREDPAAVEPAHARAEDAVPVEVPRLQLGRRLVGAVVEDDRSADAETAIAVDRRHVRPADAVVRERLVDRRDAHRAHLPRDELADRVVDHRGRDGGSEAEAVREVRRAVELAAAHVDGARRGFSERDDAGVEPVDQRAQGEEVERASGRNLEGLSHGSGVTLAQRAAADAGGRRPRDRSRDCACRDERPGRSPAPRATSTPRAARSR